MLAPSPANDPGELYYREIARIRANFERSRNGRQAVAQRSAAVDRLLTALFPAHLPESHGLSLLAVGGYGRQELLPFSDIDLLFLCAEEPGENTRAGIRALCRQLWDLRLRVSPLTHTLASCDRFYYDNVEFTVSLLDLRYVAGDAGLFAQLHERILPRLLRREWQPLVQRIAEANRSRHKKYGDTIFHLEPNVKDGPGGLRDYHTAMWLAMMAQIEKDRPWPDRKERFAGAEGELLSAAADFALSVRCFLHYRSGRDDNKLEWEAQQAAAAEGIGMAGCAAAVKDWMRAYFRNARWLYRTASQALEEVPASRSALYRGYQLWRSRVSNADFSVLGGRILLHTSKVSDPELLLRTFAFAARHSLRLSKDAERRIANAMPELAPQLTGERAWRPLQDVLRYAGAGIALREMHSLGVLDALLPEFQLIDTLVVRDSYHRYTVDEHTFVAIDNIHALDHPEGEWEKRLSEIKAHTERIDLLCLALLLHDVGKGASEESHVQSSKELAARALERLELPPSDRELVLFLIGSHLEMSALMRRDIFAPETSRALAQKVKTPERLKMLCLLTYADIKAVHPDALTPWKAENLWRLFIAASNELNRTVDQKRLDGEEAAERMAEAVTHAGGATQAARDFLRGLPERYVRSHSPAAVRTHMSMAAQLAVDPVQVSLETRAGLHEITVVTRDRPLLFASIAGVLYAWGLDIAKADAFSNSAGVIVDTFLCKDRFRTLELNPPERERFKRSLREVLKGEANLRLLIESRARTERRRPRIKVATKLEFNNESSPHCTVLEVVAQDRPGLLHSIASVLGAQGCEIEIALIDTEGDSAIDVFYLTHGRQKLAAAKVEGVHQTLLAALQQQNEIKPPAFLF